MLNMNWTPCTGIESLDGRDAHFLCRSSLGGENEYAIFSGWFADKGIGLEIDGDDVLACWTNDDGGYQVLEENWDDGGNWTALHYVLDKDIHKIVENQK